LGSAWRWALAGALAFGLVLLLAKAWRQNRPLLRALREHGLLTPRLLLDALRIWAPLGGVVLALWLGVHAVKNVGVSWLYRHTTLDEFCRVESARAPPIVLPCTGFHGTLPEDAMHAAGVPTDVAHHLFERYRAAQEAMLSTPLATLRARALDRERFALAFAPGTVLGLAPRPPLDPLLVSLFERRQALLADPVRRARSYVAGLVPALPIAPSGEDLAAVDARIRQRVQQLHAREFAGLSASARAQVYARNRIAIPLWRVKATVDPAVLDGLARSPDEYARSAPPPAFGRLGDSSASAEDPDESIRRGIARSFADSEAAAWSVLAQRIRTPAEASASYPLLAMPRLCTLAATGEADGGENGGVFPCAELKVSGEPITLRSLGFRESLRRSLERWRTQAAFDAHVQLAALDRELSARTLEAREIAERSAAAVPERFPLGRQDCRPWRPDNCLANALSASLESAALAAANERATRSIDAGALGAKAQIDAARLAAGPRIDDLYRGARATLERSFAWLDLLAIVGYLVLALVVIKSLLYVLALELFHKDSKLSIAFDVDAGAVPVADGTVVHGPTVVIDKDFPYALITKTQMGNTNSSLQWLAWPWSAPIHRLLRRRYAFFNRGTFLAHDAGGSDDASGMVASASSPLSVVMWKMQPGEEVVFSYRDFYGASENITLEKEISLRLSTLLLGRWIWHFARCHDGEGILLLKAHVQHVDQERVSAVPRARLVAFDRHMRFKADSHRHPWRSLVNDFTLVRSREPGLPPGRWITAPEHAGAGPFDRLLAFVKSVWSALF
jgi:hypothetical protein